MMGRDDAAGVTWVPFKGACTGALTGLALFVLVVGLEPAALARDGVTASQLAGIYIGGGTISGLIGGVLWPYQRTRIETLIFAIPTAIPVYLMVMLAIGGPLWIGLWAGLVSGCTYALLYGGQHRDKPSKPRPRHQGRE